MRVLVVDDDPLVLAVIEEMLGSRGFEVTGAGSADRARVRLAAKRFDILLIDAPMVRLRGIELACEVRASGTPILMIPAGSDVAAQVEEAGLPFLTKPFTDEALVVAIDRVTRGLG
jgi:DNA-binding response OmpR family regulator